jgi:hypothetical protein
MSDSVTTQQRMDGERGRVAFSDIGFLTASQFSRLSSARLKELKPVTILLDGNKPVAVVVEFNRYLAMQDAD